jgi:TolA-binding protein
MKLLRFTVCLAFAAVFAAPAYGASKPTTVTHPKVAAVKVAPADEYFGRQKISSLGIDNMIRDTETREGFDPALASRLYNALQPAEEALQDWTRKYPQDSWIPKRAYLLSHLFWRMHTPEASAAAERCRSVLFKYFPKNRFAALAKSESETTYAPVVAASPTPAAAGVAK